MEQSSKPTVVLSDHGTQFTSSTWQEALRKDGIQPIMSSVYHPQSNPVERRMRTLGQMLRALCHHRQQSWALHVKPIEDVINNTVQAATGQTPMEVLTGRAQPFIRMSERDRPLGHNEETSEDPEETHKEELVKLVKARLHASAQSRRAAIK